MNILPASYPPVAPITPDDQPLIVPLKDAGWLWGKPEYKVVVQWEWIWRGILILARKGYHFAAASIPRPFWGLLGYTPDGLHRAPSTPSSPLAPSRSSSPSQFGGKPKATRRS